jgi:hypothetical protein
MSMTEPQLPKLLLSLELVTCFLPSSYLWVWTLRAMVNHVLQTGSALYLVSAASIGPVGLVLFGRVVVGGSGFPGKHWSFVLMSLAGWIAVVILLLPWMTGRENLAVVASIKGLEHKYIGAALAAVDMLESADREVKSYSLGMKQRLALAGAMLGDPEFLILDEPTNGLDPSPWSETRQLSSAGISRERGRLSREAA